MCAAEMIEHRKNSWELYGFDFMVDDEYNAWLIEINSSPACDYSTSVTERYVQKALVELLAVVLDVREWETQPKKTRGACPDTGGWEKIYQGPLLDMPAGAFGTEMSLKGEAYKNLPRPVNNNVANMSVQQVDFGGRAAATVSQASAGATNASVKRPIQQDWTKTVVQHASSSDKDADSPKRAQKPSGAAPAPVCQHRSLSKPAAAGSMDDADESAEDTPSEGEGDGGFDDSDDEEGGEPKPKRSAHKKAPKQERVKVQQSELAAGSGSPPPQHTTAAGATTSSRHHKAEAQKGNRQVVGAPAVASIPIKVFSVEF